MFDEKLLASFNQCPYTSLEALFKKPSLYTMLASNVIIFTSNSERTNRVLLRDEKGNFISGLLITCQHKSKVYDIQGVYTLPEYRRQGLASSLLVIARVCFKDVRHSDCLTELGQKFVGV